MRIPALVAIPLLIAGCSHTVGGNAAPAPPALPSTAASGPPAAGTPIAAVIAWIKAAHPADPARYQLDGNVAFSAPGGKVKCTTDSRHIAGLLSCLVNLTTPPPRPDTAYGDWKGGWVDFDGTSLQVGAARADPGPFLAGTGAELSGGDSLTFGDYGCRSEQDGLVCANYAHQSAARFSAAGVQPYGCLQPAPPPEGVGVEFKCARSQ